MIRKCLILSALAPLLLCGCNGHPDISADDKPDEISISATPDSKYWNKFGSEKDRDCYFLVIIKSLKENKFVYHKGNGSPEYEGHFSEWETKNNGETLKLTLKFQSSVSFPKSAEFSHYDVFSDNTNPGISYLEYENTKFAYIGALKRQ